MHPPYFKMTYVKEVDLSSIYEEEEPELKGLTEKAKISVQCIRND